MTDNTEQAEFWNGRMGDAWVTVEDNIDKMMAPMTESAISVLAPAMGQRIIDIGCGCGSTSIMIADTGAEVWGIDIADKMIRQAKSKSSNVTFSVADAASQAFEADYDGIFSRFGIMFFSDPEAAFKNLKSALKPTGRFVFLCWQAPIQNPWMALVGNALQAYQPDDLPTPDPTAPGPFALADPDRTEKLLTAAGFTDISIEGIKKEVYLGRDVDEVIEFQRHVGPLSALLAETEPSRHDELIGVARGVFEPFVNAKGIRLPAAVWLVEAS
ncbi:MAG: SAM-dependent methyltransferase [Halioglobus sp.]|jgi:SAM-dependent methyltransferase